MKFKYIKLIENECKSTEIYCTFSMPPLTTDGGGIMSLGCSSGRPLSINTYFAWRDICLLSKIIIHACDKTYKPFFVTYYFYC